MARTSYTDFYAPDGPDERGVMSQSTSTLAATQTISSGTLFATCFQARSGSAVKVHAYELDTPSGNTMGSGRVELWTARTDNRLPDAFISGSRADVYGLRSALNRRIVFGLNPTALTPGQLYYVVMTNLIPTWSFPVGASDLNDSGVYGDAYTSTNGGVTWVGAVNGLSCCIEYADGSGQWLGEFSESINPSATSPFPDIYGDRMCGIRYRVPGPGREIIRSVEVSPDQFNTAAGNLVFRAYVSGVLLREHTLPSGYFASSDPSRIPLDVSAAPGDLVDVLVSAPNASTTSFGFTSLRCFDGGDLGWTGLYSFSGGYGGILEYVDFIPQKVTLFAEPQEGAHPIGGSIAVDPAVAWGLGSSLRVRSEGWVPLAFSRSVYVMSSGSWTYSIRMRRDDGMTGYPQVLLSGSAVGPEITLSSDGGATGQFALYQQALSLSSGMLHISYRHLSPASGSTANAWFDAETWSQA